MGFALGQKIDARLIEIERKLNERIAQLEKRIEELEAKRGPGRPKAPDGK
jgi:BMFP domain-containing protein YqiC